MNKNPLYAVPNEWSSIINTQTKLCRLCKSRTVIGSAWHMKYWHGSNVPSVNYIWKNKVKPLTMKRGKRRKALREELKRTIVAYLQPPDNKRKGQTETDIMDIEIKLDA